MNLYDISTELIELYWGNVEKANFVGPFRRQIKHPKEFHILILNHIWVTPNHPDLVLVESGHVIRHYTWKGVPLTVRRLQPVESFGTLSMIFTGPKSFVDLMQKERKRGGYMPSNLYFDSKINAYKDGKDILVFNDEESLFKRFQFESPPHPKYRGRFKLFEDLDKFNNYVRSSNERYK